MKRAPAVLKKMKSTAKEVKKKLKEDGATNRGKEKIRTQMTQMRKEFELLNQEMRREMGLDLNENNDENNDESK